MLFSAVSIFTRNADLNVEYWRSYPDFIHYGHMVSYFEFHSLIHLKFKFLSMSLIDFKFRNQNFHSESKMFSFNCSFSNVWTSIFLPVSGELKKKINSNKWTDILTGFLLHPSRGTWINCCHVSTSDVLCAVIMSFVAATATPFTWLIRRRVGPWKCPVTSRLLWSSICLRRLFGIFNATRFQRQWSIIEWFFPLCLGGTRWNNSLRIQLRKMPVKVTRMKTNPGRWPARL